ncbi:hypothetical protein MY10362_004094 [Beauveria mimosiformis]
MAKPGDAVNAHSPTGITSGRVSVIDTASGQIILINSALWAVIVINTNWASCQTNGSDCSLGTSPLSDPTAPFRKQCQQGSVPSYYIDVGDKSDVQAGLAFARQHNIRLVIKNTGHDYKGRSSGPDALALWMHNVQPSLEFTESYTPEGCPAVPVGDTITFGAGQTFRGIYDFAHQHQRVFVGGGSFSVGAAGGWIAGGGHSMLSPTKGLGVDNVQQLKAVLPNGIFITANRCQNQDFFFALRGGGGGTFGIVMEMTALLATYVFTSLNHSATTTLLSIMVDNADKWAKEGWGGYLMPGALTDQSSVVILVTPSLTHQDAVLSMKPLGDFVSSLGNIHIPTFAGVETKDSFSEVLKSPFLTGLDSTNNAGYAVASRLIPRKYFQGEENKTRLGTLLSDTLRSARDGNLLSFLPMLICITAPSSYKLPLSDEPGNIGESSTSPAWRSSLWHVMSIRNWDSAKNDPQFVRDQFDSVSKSINPLRDFTPEGGAYQNEADTFEPDPVAAFWGQEHYNRLLAIKKDIDPTNLLTCHQCIGWDATDPRFNCYPRL